MEVHYDFSLALSHLMEPGIKMQRTGWNGKGQYVQAQYPDAHSKMSKPYLYLTDSGGNKVPWVPSQGDLFADDWVMVKD